ncbi:major facilitator superfamily domain-containing protein [Microdochium trichocladiopsis]|uniref:Major facilitator superfamily domain-containing protein n=1 Tax=Microdochium trichocladiopsis TaxID=1682393 RepID=A0A9P8XZ55_9PEZI|nr:major facilitator superfamily domain-containing protein [Microdochium trichocladiopsis]KAH7024343.1 major facilitator superfamily domain-containing protein [Microdochium trichocladiopsis]
MDDPAPDVKPTPREITRQDSSGKGASAELSELDLALQTYVPESLEEKKLRRKVDLWMIPMLWWMCVLCYVDRNNIGNANAAGMSTDLGLNSSQYAMLISIFFIAYLIMETPSNLILTRVRPSFYVPLTMVLWGTITAAMSQVRNYTDILVARFFLGAIEAGFFPGVMYIMSAWYKRSEIGKRFSLFFTALCFAGAVSGLISGAVISGLEGKHGMQGWRWLFLIEGVITVFFGFVAKFVLFDYPENTKRLSAEERQLAIVRMMHDRQATAVLQTARLGPLAAIRAAACDLRTYVFVVLYMLDNGSTTISYFIPTVLKSMGYTGTTVQWMTIPVWAVATVFLIVVPQVADRLGDRRWSITAGLTMSFVSAIVLFQVQHNITRYVFLCFYISGLYFTLPLIMTWASTLMPLPAEKRAVVIALTNSIGNLSAVYGSQLWPATHAPTYATGFTSVACFTGIGALIAAVAPYLFKVLPRFPSKEEKEVLEAQRRAQEELEE